MTLYVQVQVAQNPNSDQRTALVKFSMGKDLESAANLGLLAMTLSEWRSFRHHLTVPDLEPEASEGRQLALVIEERAFGTKSNLK